MSGSVVEMSQSRSESSSESLSIYETPITSPLNESVVNSTQMDSSLFDTTSPNSQLIDLFDFRHPFDVMSVRTDSTLRQTVRQSDTTALNDRIAATTSASVPEPSIWLRQQLMSEVLSERQLVFSDANRTDIYVLLRKYISEMDFELLEMIGIEQQIQSISLKCRTIRENIISKRDSIYSLINELVVNPKGMEEKETQTESKVNNLEPILIESNCLSSDVFQYKGNVSIMSDKSKSYEFESNECNPCFSELSDNMKKALNRLPALVKGYLVRRLMKTEKVLQTMETIRDTTQLLTNYRKISPQKRITVEDINFHKRLIIQLSNSCREFYDIFMNYPKSAQMALISRSREHILERHYRIGSVLSNSSYLSPNHNRNTRQTNGLSSVTKKVMERKKRINSSQSNSSQSNTSLKHQIRPQSAKNLIQSYSNNSIIPSIGRTQPNSHFNSVQTLKRKANFDKK